MLEKKLKGRGASFNPKNRFEKLEMDAFKPDEIDLNEEDFAEVKIPTVYLKDESKSVISVNDSPDIGFDYSFNPYRGCEHGCIYCYARPSHEFLGFSAGIDFETKIMVKENAPELLEAQFKKKSYKPDVIIFSGNTDCYQPLEKKLEITRRTLQVCLKYRNPVSIITKNALVQRDIDILKEMAKLDLVNVTISITSLDKEIIRKMEPRTSIPVRRLETIKAMRDNGIIAGVNVAPIIPGLTDEEIPAIIKSAAENGALYAGHIIVRLPYAVKDLFVNWVEKEFSDRASKILNRIKDVRGGKLNQSEWGKRFSGEGEIAETIHNLFKISCKRHNLNEKKYNLSIENFVTSYNNQLNLFYNQ
jgi:DNA repair photolyase